MIRLHLDDTFTYYYQSYVQASSISNHLFMIYSKNKFFYKITYLALTFDLVTLTFCQLQHLNNTYHVYVHHQCAIIGSWYIAKTRFYTKLHIWPWPLTLWPWPWVNFNNPSILIMCISIINIQTLVHDI